MYSCAQTKINSREPSWMVWKYSSLQNSAHPVDFHAFFRDRKWRISNVIDTDMTCWINKFQYVLIFFCWCKFFWMTLNVHWILSIFIIRFQTQESMFQLSQTMSVQQNVDYFSQNNSSLGALDLLWFIFVAIILFHSIMIFGTTFSYTARVHTFKKNVEAGRKRQELSFFGGDGINRPDLIVIALLPVLAW